MITERADAWILFMQSALIRADKAETYVEPKQRAEAAAELADEALKQFEKRYDVAPHSAIGPVRWTRRETSDAK